MAWINQWTDQQMDGHISIDLNWLWLALFDEATDIKSLLKIHLVVDKNITIVGVRLAGNKNILKQWKKKCGGAWIGGPDLRICQGAHNFWWRPWIMIDHGIAVTNLTIFNNIFYLKAILSWSPKVNCENKSILSKEYKFLLDF